VKTLLLVVGLASLTPIGALAESWTGTLSDSRCGAKHEAASAADVECIKTCMKQGAVPVLVTGGKVLSIASSSNDKVAPHIGEKVTITGTVERSRFGQIIVVESITKAE
jgi:hypothetical protein